MRVCFRLVFAAALVLLAAGCYFEHPLTGGPNRNLNTWLLGVWESKDDQGRVSKIQVTPINVDRYAVSVSLPGKRGNERRKYEFEAWTSRVAGTTFLSLQCLESPGDIPTGAFVFSQVQLLTQNSIRTREVKLDSDPSASSYELRREVRAKLRDLTLYEDGLTADWKRVAEVYWSMDGGDPVFTPIRNPAN